MALAQHDRRPSRARTVKIGKEAFYRQLEMPLAEAYDYASQVMTENMLAAEAEKASAPSWKSASRKWPRVQCPQYPDDLIKSILRSIKTIAMVGASGNDIRPSYFAMMYLLNKGYKIIPGQSRHGGQEDPGPDGLCSLKDVPAPVDMVDIFRECRMRARHRARGAGGKRPAGRQDDLDAAGRDQRGSRGDGARCRPDRHHGPLPQDRAWPLFRRDRLDGRQPQGDRQPQAACCSARAAASTASEPC